MLARNPTELPFIAPGHGFLPEGQTRLCTVVGSGVAVTLFDRSKKQGGMIHYALPKRNVSKSNSSMYAEPAILALLQMFRNIGSHPQELDAQIYGGGKNAQHPKFRSQVHEQNVDSAWKLLEKEGVSVSYQDVGGDKGRKVCFDSSTGETMVARVNHIRDEDWYPA